MNLQDFLSAIDYKITDGTKFLWDCFGYDAYILDCEEENTYSISCTFDTKTQLIYLVETHDYVNDRAYRWVNPEYKQSYFDLCKSKNIVEDQAYLNDDDKEITFIDLEVAEDYLEKTSKIVKHLPYDENITLPLDIPDDVLLKLMITAHEQDITFNQYINKILKDALNEFGKNI